MAPFTWVWSSCSHPLALGRALGFGKLARYIHVFLPTNLLLLVVSLGQEGYLDNRYICYDILRVIFSIQYFSWLGGIFAPGRTWEGSYSVSAHNHDWNIIFWASWISIEIIHWNITGLRQNSFILWSFLDSRWQLFVVTHSMTHWLVTDIQNLRLCTVVGKSSTRKPICASLFPEIVKIFINAFTEMSF